MLLAGLLLIMRRINSV